MKKIFIGVFSLLILSAHTLFLRTNAYFLDPNEESELFLFNGTFDTSENEITRDRITDTRIIGPNYNFVPTTNDWYDKEKVTYLKFKSGEAGTYVAGISTKPKVIELTAKEFNEYLEHDGVLDVLKARQENGEMAKPSKEFYAKHVKLVLQVADQKTKDYQKVFGYPLEFVPVDNPYAAKIGDKLSFILYKNGKPLANQLVYSGHRVKNANTAEHSHEEPIRTDDQGKFSIEVDHQGIEYLTSIDMVKSSDKQYDYISNWATITFEIK